MGGDGVCDKRQATRRTEERIKNAGAGCGRLIEFGFIWEMPDEGSVQWMKE